MSKPPLTPKLQAHLRAPGASKQLKSSNNIYIYLQFICFTICRCANASNSVHPAEYLSIISIEFIVPIDPLSKSTLKGRGERYLIVRTFAAISFLLLTYLGIN